MITIQYGNAQNQVAWGPQQPGLVRSVPIHGREQVDFYGPFQSKAYENLLFSV